MSDNYLGEKNAVIRETGEIIRVQLCDIHQEKGAVYKDEDGQKYYWYELAIGGQIPDLIEEFPKAFIDKSIGLIMMG